MTKAHPKASLFFAEETCLAGKREVVLENMFSKCLPPYNTRSEDTTPYSQPRWIPVQNLSNVQSEFELLRLCPKPWRYQTANELQALSYQGQMFSYGGGGFVAELGYNARSALKIINDLEKNIWIDEKTVAVFVEFLVFEPSSSLFSSVKYLYERLQSGGSLSTTTVKTMALYGVLDPNLRFFFEVCQLLLMLFISYFVFQEIAKIFYEGRAYFRQFWNWVKLLEIASAVSAIAMLFLKEAHTTKFVKKVQSNPFETSSIDNIMLWTDLEVYLLALVVFTATVKLLRILRYNRHICQMMGTIKKSVKPLFSFSAVFFVAVIPFAQLGFQLFGPSVFNYSTFFQSLRELLTMTIDGTMEFENLSNVHHWLAPCFLFWYMLCMNYVLMDVFIAILVDNYQELKNKHDEEYLFDAEMGEFMVDYFTNCARVALTNVIKAILPKYKTGSTRRIAVRKKSPRATSNNRTVPSTHSAVYFDQESFSFDGETKKHSSCESQSSADNVANYLDDEASLEDKVFVEITVILMDISAQLRQSISPNVAESGNEYFDQPLDALGGLRCVCQAEL